MKILLSLVVFAIPAACGTITVSVAPSTTPSFVVSFDGATSGFIGDGSEMRTLFGLYFGGGGSDNWAFAQSGTDPEVRITYLGGYASRIAPELGYPAPLSEDDLIENLSQPRAFNLYDSNGKFVDSAEVVLAYESKTWILTAMALCSFAFKRRFV